ELILSRIELAVDVKRVGRVAHNGKAVALDLNGLAGPGVREPMRIRVVDGAAWIAEVRIADPLELLDAGNIGQEQVPELVERRMDMMPAPGQAIAGRQVIGPRGHYIDGTPGLPAVVTVPEEESVGPGRMVLGAIVAAVPAGRGEKHVMRTVGVRDRADRES